MQLHWFSGAVEQWLSGSMDQMSSGPWGGGGHFHSKVIGIMLVVFFRV